MPRPCAKFDEHVDASGTYVPAWLSPEIRKQKSQDAFDAAMKVAREQGFAQAAPLFEGVRGDCFAPAQVAIAVHELRELGDVDSALRRLRAFGQEIHSKGRSRPSLRRTAPVELRAQAPQRLGNG